MRPARAVLLLCLLAWPSAALAQTPATPGSRFGWTQTAATLADAQGLTYRAYLDGATISQVLTATCAAGPTATTFACSAPIPAVTAGAHTVQFTATNMAGESPRSGTLAFTMLAVPSAPFDLSILP